jgi:hypothetical protein
VLATYQCGNEGTDLRRINELHDRARDRDVAVNWIVENLAEVIRLLLHASRLRKKVHRLAARWADGGFEPRSGLKYFLI